MAAEAPQSGQQRELDLDDREVRVLGCLIEKDLSTPDYYPMTINALRTACNQKTNREPVVDYSETEVVGALDGLQKKRLVGNASSSYGRAAKFRHALAEAVNLDRPHIAVLASVLLRGPQTSGEIRGRTTRMHDFESIDEVEKTLNELVEWDPPLITHLPRQPGQKEDRWGHLFAGEPEIAPAPTPTSRGGSDRIGELEEEVAALKESLQTLTDRFEAFRKQFE